MIIRYDTLGACGILLLNFIILIRSCKISEFACKGSGLCLPLDKYCDGIDQCGDLSDEPKFCTVCNRTYYGDIGRTYSIQVPTPQRFPFLCHLTFTASGHEQGDIVQIIFDGFTVGRYDEGLEEHDFEATDTSLMSASGTDACPDGYMQLSELGRPFTGGSWCGTASGPQQYFSETSTVTASVKVFHAPSLQQEIPFEFRIRYKFLSHTEAVVRYGTSSDLYDLGLVTPGTYCTRQFEECYRNKCRLQSPNYPGMYPRNVTCYWTIRQKTIPTCKHAMIAVSQENSHKSLVKRSIASLNKTARTIRAWSDCTGERDHLIFYDGSSTNDPVLAKFCGGDWLPKVVSRSSEMLIAFHSSPYSAPLQTGTPNRGFELNVDILFTDSDSYNFMQNIKCEFHINASSPDDVIMSQRNGRMGRLLSPRHTLPPNTTCTYYFHGFPNDLIWLSFTSHHLQLLQPVNHDNLTQSFGQSDQPSTSYITRMRLYDSIGTQNQNKLQSTPSTLGMSLQQHQQQQQRLNITKLKQNKNYYRGEDTKNPYDYKNYKFNMEQSWNPVNNYIYGPTVNSIYNQQPDKETSTHRKLERILNINSINNRDRDRGERERDRDRDRVDKGNKIVDGMEYEKDSYGKMKNRPEKSSSNRKLLGEFINNEAPKLCDQAINDYQTDSIKMRHCTPLESYISTGRDMKLEFHTATGTALYPYSFSVNYEFVDTEMGGDFLKFDEHNDDDKKMESEYPLCSRTFRNRRGEFRSPRNVFLHGRGGAKNLSCLYRFEANVGEQIRITLYNISFGESGFCSTENDIHTGRPRCQIPDSTSGIESNNVNKLSNDDSSKVRELRIYDVPYPHSARVQLGCICDNQSIFYNQPLTFQSSSSTMELTFIATKLNITEDFMDLYFYASYEIVKVSECKRKHKLTGTGGEEKAYFNIRNLDSNCDGMAWLVEAKRLDHSLFVQTWGTQLPQNPTPEELVKCQTKNRLIIYSGHTSGVVRIICPALKSETRQMSLRIMDEDWLNSSTMPTKPISMIIEPILREPGSVSFSWMEIQRTKASLVQHLDQQTNYTANETLMEFGLYPKGGDCEHKCPELNACIASNLWCDGYPNCPSGFDESSSECGATRKLLELPASLYAALGCLAAGIAACLIFCMVGISRRRKKTKEPKQHPTQTAIPIPNGTYTLPKSNGNTYQKNSLFYNNHDHDS
ncbi:uncharacterized protein [Chironomus tepperi]|uniref:uncharacterized protein n=1 Tax=Chironomus tepperi TaxID=113505 RepID=UPI00391EFBDC